VIRRRQLVKEIGAVAVATIAPLLGAFLGLASGLIIGILFIQDPNGTMDVGFAMATGMLALLLGLIGLACGFWISVKALGLGSQWKAGRKAMDR
jgi:hypothetical protein